MDSRPGEENICNSSSGRRFLSSNINFLIKDDIDSHLFLKINTIQNMFSLLIGYTTMYAGKYMNQYGGREAGGMGQVKSKTDSISIRAGQA